MTAEVAAAAILAQQPRARKILIVEDESVVAMDLKSQLTDMGYEICACEDSGRGAIAAAKTHRPDLVLMDIVLKGDVDGIAAAEYIGRVLHIPVVFLTAYSDDRTVSRAARAAPYGYLTKPFQARELRAGIEVALYKAELERKLRNSEQWFASTLRCVGDAVVATEADGRVRFMNPAAESLLGWRMEEAKGRDIGEVVRFENARTQAVIPSPVWQALSNDAVTNVDFGSLLVTRSGSRLPIDDSAAPIRDHRGQVLGAVLVFRDVQERLAAEQQLRQSEARFRSAFDFAPVGMALVGLDNHFLQVNGALCALLQADATELIGADQTHYSRQEDLEAERVLLYKLMAGHSTAEQFEKRYRTKSGKDVWTLVSVSLLHQDDAPLCFLFQIHDVSQRKQAEFRLARLAHYDVLTGLANRAWLSEEIEREITAARRHQRRLAVVFMDLDHFKQINDSLGHEAGDEVLKIIAARLKSSIRESDTAARLGGDEFVMLLPEILEVEDVLVVSNKVQVECGRAMQIAGQDIRIGMSLGVSLFPDDAQDSQALLRYADSALYLAKAEGRNNLQFYRPELTARMEQRMHLGAALRGAIERDELELYYQPIVSLTDRMPRAAEALLRWNHPQLGLLAPDSFVPLAEETGLSAGIGSWVIEQACHQAAAWNARGDTAIDIAVNVSPSQFRSGDLLQVVRHALDTSGLGAEQLCIEITEQLLLHDSEKNRQTISELKAMGVRIAIDDFGTGYSSLSYISHFQPSELKIDRSLIAHAGVDSESTGILTAAIAMARSLNLKIVTEGVETEEQERFLQENGCQMAQGYLYAHPLAAPDFQLWLDQGAHRQIESRVI